MSSGLGIMHIGVVSSSVEIGVVSWLVEGCIGVASLLRWFHGL